MNKNTWIAGLFAVLLTLSAAAKTPRPQKSQYLRSESAGFVMSEEKGVIYSLAFKSRQKLEAPLFVTVQFENPSNAATPLVLQTKLEPGQEVLSVQSPRLTEITHDKVYQVEVLLYSDEARTALVGRHRQDVLFSVAPQLEAMVEQRYHIRIH